MKIYQTIASLDHPKEVRKGSDTAIVSRMTVGGVHTYTVTLLASGRLIVNRAGGEIWDVVVDQEISHGVCRDCGVCERLTTYDVCRDCDSEIYPKK